MYKRLSLIITLCLTGICSLFAQQETSASLYGFVRSDFFLDSRASKTGIQDMHMFYPLYSNPNANGDDLNAVPNAGLNSITSRLGVNVNGTGILGASASQSAIEMDFCGSPNYWIVRMRQAYIKLKFSSSELLVGQTWHPLFTSSVMPNVLSLNTGSPFQPFNRSPQIRYDVMDGNLKWTAAGVWQMMYTSNGPLGSVMTYQKNALIPNLYASVEYKKDEWLTGIGLDYKCILPERYILNANNVQVINNKRLHTPTVTAYGLYKTPEILVQAKALLGQNLADHSLIGGYAITPTHDYVPYNTFSSYVNVVSGKVHQVGMLAGYSSILGPAKDLPVNSTFYGLGAENANDPLIEKMVHSIYRLSPSYSYNIGKWKVGAELEMTAADWATRKTDGKLDTYETTNNYRLYAIAMYRF